MNAGSTVQDSFDRLELGCESIKDSIIATNSKAEENSSEAKIFNGGTVFLELVNEKIRQTLFGELIDQIQIVQMRVQISEIYMEQTNNYRLSLKGDRKI